MVVPCGADTVAFSYFCSTVFTVAVLRIDFDSKPIESVIVEMSSSHLNNAI